MSYSLYKVWFENSEQEVIEYDYGESEAEVMQNILAKYGSKVKVQKVQGLQNKAELLEAAKGV